MTDYILTKAVDKTTGQLPDKVTMILPREFAWVVLKQLLLQLQAGKERLSVDIYGMLVQK